MLSGAKASLNPPAPGQVYLSKVPPTHTHTMPNVSPGSVGCFVFYTMPTPVLFFTQCPTSTLVHTWRNKVVFRLVLPVLDLLSLNVEPLGQLVVFFFIFLPHHTACRILVPWSGIKPVPPVVQVRSLNHALQGSPFFIFWWYFLLSNTMVLELVR